MSSLIKFDLRMSKSFPLITGNPRQYLYSCNNPYLLSCPYNLSQEYPPVGRQLHNFRYLFVCMTSALVRKTLSLCFIPTHLFYPVLFYEF